MWQEETWGEMARRVLALAAAGEMVHASDGAASGGPDVALGAVCFCCKCPHQLRYTC